MPSSNVESAKEAAVLLRMTFAFVTSQVLYVAAELGIADHLAHGALSAQDLASKIGAHTDSLARLLQALVAFGVLKREGEEQFGLTPTGDFLRTDVAGSLRSTVRFLVGPWDWRAFEQLSHSVRTGEPAFDHVWGISNFEYWARNPDVSKIHDEAMAGLTATEAARVLAAYDFSQFRTIVDVGGGTGALLAAILASTWRPPAFWETCLTWSASHLVCFSRPEFQTVARSSAATSLKRYPPGETLISSSTLSTIGTTNAHGRY